MEQNQIEVELKFFGALRKYSEYLSVQKLIVKQGSTVSDIKIILTAKLESLSENFTDANLISSSAIANENEVLSNDVKFLESSKLMVLPPVCGG